MFQEEYTDNKRTHKMCNKDHNQISLLIRIAKNGDDSKCQQEFRETGSLTLFYFFFESVKCYSNSR
jgi:hypothetical protein